MAQTSTSKEYDELKEDLTKLRGDVERLVKALSEEQRENAADLRARAREQVDRAKKAGAEAIDRAGRMSRDSVDAAEQTVREHPLLSLLAAFGLGLLIAQLLDRR